MSVLFSIAFLAAVVGVLKPYISGWKRWHFGLAAFVSLFLIGAFVPKTDSGTVASVGTEIPVKRDDPAAADVPESNWDYRESTDEMRGTKTKVARVVSDNEVNLDFPYGVVNGYLTVRQQKQDGLSIMFSVDEGQILCHSFNDSHVSVKFDDQPIKRYSCTDTSDGSSNLVFILNERNFLTNLKKSKRVIVEGEFFQQGNQQFTFKTAGLNWE